MGRIRAQKRTEASLRNFIRHIAYECCGGFIPSLTLLFRVGFNVVPMFLFHVLGALEIIRR